MLVGGGGVGGAVSGFMFKHERETVTGCGWLKNRPAWVQGLMSRGQEQVGSLVGGRGAGSGEGVSPCALGFPSRSGVLIHQKNICTPTRCARNFASC